MCKKHFAHFRFVMHFLYPLGAIPTTTVNLIAPLPTATWNTQYANNPRICQVYLLTSYYPKLRLLKEQILRQSFKDDLNNNFSINLENIVS